MIEDIEHLTLDQFAAMTGLQIGTLRWQGETVSDTALQHDAAGNVVTQTTVTIYVLDGKKTGSVICDFTYYADDIIDMITERTLDAADNEVGRRVIKHYLDGRPPTVTDVMPTIVELVPEPEPVPALEPAVFEKPSVPEKKPPRVFGVKLYDRKFWKRLLRRK